MDKYSDTKRQIKDLIDNGKYSVLGSELGFAFNKIMVKQVSDLQKLERKVGRHSTRGTMLANEMTLFFTKVAVLTNINMDELINEIGGE